MLIPELYLSEVIGTLFYDLPELKSTKCENTKSKNQKIITGKMKISKTKNGKKSTTTGDRGGQVTW
jgi:hypothetical protein